MKKAVALLVMFSVIFASLSASVAAKSSYDYKVNVQVNKVPIQSDVSAFIDQSVNRTYVPIRFVSEALGESVLWKDKKVTVKKRTGTVIVFSPNQKVAYVNGTKKSLDAPAIQTKDRVLVPLRFVSENLGATVDVSKVIGWTTVNISYPDAPNTQNDAPKPQNPDTTSTKKSEFSKFELDPNYNKLAPYLFKDNMRVENGELVFTVPKLDRFDAVYTNWGSDVELTPGKEYRYKLGDSKGYVMFTLAHADENIEGYSIALSSDHLLLDDSFAHVKDDAIVVHDHNLTMKSTASPLSDVLKMFN